MQTHQCSRCLATRPFDAFPLLNGRVQGTRCKPCHAELRRIERAEKKAAQPPKPQPFRDRDRTTKVCNRCGIEKPVADFYWNQRKWSGACKPCRLEVERLKREAYRAVHPVKPKGVPFKDRFWTKVDKNGPIPSHRPDLGQCWIWLAYKKADGYGIFLRGDGYPATNAHRVAHELTIGPIPDGLHVDHLCRNRSCVNPSHLEAVTCQENLHRGEGTVGKNFRKTHCIRGHPFDEENTYRTSKGRYCRECRRLHNKTHITKK